MFGMSRLVEAVEYDLEGDAEPLGPAWSLGNAVTAGGGWGVDEVLARMVASMSRDSFAG
jgi:hypothetical protein